MLADFMTGKRAVSFHNATCLLPCHYVVEKEHHTFSSFIDILIPLMVMKLIIKIISKNAILFLAPLRARGREREGEHTGLLSKCLQWPLVGVKARSQKLGSDDAWGMTRIKLHETLSPPLRIFSNRNGRWV